MTFWHRISRSSPFEPALSGCYEGVTVGLGGYNIFDLAVVSLICNFHVLGAAMQPLAAAPTLVGLQECGAQTKRAEKGSDLQMLTGQGCTGLSTHTGQGVHGF